MITTIDSLIKELDGPTQLARKLGCTSQNISLWVLRGEIPPGWHYRLHLLASARGLHINAHKVFGVPRNFADTYGRTT